MNECTCKTCGKTFTPSHPAEEQAADTGLCFDCLQNQRIQAYNGMKKLMKEQRAQTKRMCDRIARNSRRRRNDRVAVRPVQLLGDGIDSQEGDDEAAPQGGLVNRQESAMPGVQREIPQDDEGEVRMKCPICGELLVESEDIYYCSHCGIIHKWVKAPVGVDEEDDWEAEE